MKLQLHELRVGNLIQTGGQIIAVTAKLLATFEENEGYIKMYKPVALTNKILIDFGFEEEPISYKLNINPYKRIDVEKALVFSGDYLYIQESETPTAPPSDIITLWNKDIMKEFYVHELQNLHLDLTRKQLKARPIKAK